MTNTPLNQQAEEIEHTPPQVEETLTFGGAGVWRIMNNLPLQSEDEWIKKFDKRFPKEIDIAGIKLILGSRLAILDHIQDQRQQAAEEATLKERARCLDDMFLEIAKLAEPDERQPSAGDLHTNMDEIHRIRNKIKNG